MPEWLIARWPLKLLALALGFAIWLAVTGEVAIPQDYRVPLDVSLAKDVVLTGEPPSAVSVRVRGPESVVRVIDPLRLAFRVDLRDARPGRRSVLLTPDRLDGIPRGVDVLRIDPDRVSFDLDRRMRRSLPVEPSLEGAVPDGFHVYQVLSIPRTLDVVGPETKVDRLGELRTDPVLLDRRTGSFSVRVGALPDDPDVRVIGPSRPEIRVEIDEEPQRAEIDAVPVVLAGPHSAEIRPAAVTVALQGPPKLLETIGPGKLRAVADLGGTDDEAPRGSQRVPLRVEFVGLDESARAKLTVRSISPERVTVRFGGAPSE